RTWRINRSTPPLNGYRGSRCVNGLWSLTSVTASCSRTTCPGLRRWERECGVSERATSVSSRSHRDVIDHVGASARFRELVLRRRARPILGGIDYARRGEASRYLYGAGFSGAPRPLACHVGGGRDPGAAEGPCIASRRREP